MHASLPAEARFQPRPSQSTPTPARVPPEDKRVLRGSFFLLRRRLQRPLLCVPRKGQNCRHNLLEAGDVVGAHLRQCGAPRKLWVAERCKAANGSGVGKALELQLELNAKGSLVAQAVNKRDACNAARGGRGRAVRKKGKGKLGVVFLFLALLTPSRGAGCTVWARTASVPVGGGKTKKCGWPPPPMQGSKRTRREHSAGAGVRRVTLTDLHDGNLLGSCALAEVH